MSEGGREPLGTVALIVGEVGRSSAGRGRARSAPGAPSSGSAATNAAAAPPSASQWMWQWTADGPGPVRARGDQEADLTLSLTPADAALVRQGELAPCVAFMQGRLKTSGDNALLLRVLEWSSTPAFSSALEQAGA